MIAGIRKFRQFCVGSVLFKWEQENFVLNMNSPYEPKSDSVHWRNPRFVRGRVRLEVGICVVGKAASLVI